MRKMNNIEYTQVVRELKPLAGKHFENVYSVGENKLRIKIGGVDVICEPGVRMHVTKYLEEGGELTNFTKVLRKEFENARLRDIYQHNNDRVIVFDFGERKIVFEMFADGNIILTEGEKILMPLHNEEWSDRKIARNEDYIFPKSNIKTTVEDALDVAKEKYVIVALMQLPLGKEYAQDILARCNVEEKKAAKELTVTEIGDMTSAFEKLKKLDGAYAVYEQEKIVDFCILPFLKYEKLQAKGFKTLSEAVDEFYQENRQEKNEKIEKLKRRLGQQEKRLLQLREEEGEKGRIGNFIYENYEKIDKLLVLAKATKPKELGKKLEEIGVKAKVEKKEIEIELKEPRV